VPTAGCPSTSIARGAVMPIVIPTPDEISQMNHRERESWRKRMRVAYRDIQHSKELLSYGDMVRREALLWAHIYGDDPDAKEHQRVLMKAIE
jgi:hypothetical protein